eukprot:CAMPEP_0172322690 /NCGR_PEP_ID=MMETSP1058-20130122/46610_1 /TAXON_ID=83371 /ORGANISM="Detonula confervacea, Strain CCMP 353" /LENGTH=292 /DNA_ID=CAMNT_0013038501 /DNA_START=368 /DNA_END=1246 /DNA_ORIENTATION=+
MAMYRANGCVDLSTDFCSENGISQRCSYSLEDECGRAVCQLDSHMWLDQTCIQPGALAEYRAHGCGSLEIDSDFCKRYNGGSCMSTIHPYSCGRLLCQGDKHHPDILDQPCPDSDPCDEYGQNDMDEYLLNGCTSEDNEFCLCKYGSPDQGSYCKVDTWNLDSCNRAVCQFSEHVDLTPCAPVSSDCDDEYDQSVANMADYLSNGCNTTDDSGTSDYDKFCNCKFGHLGKSSHCMDDIEDGRDSCGRTVCQHSNHKNSNYKDLNPCNDALCCAAELEHKDGPNPKPELDPFH